MKQVIQFSATDGYFYSPGFVAGLIQLCGGNGLVDAGASRQKANRGDNCQQNADDEDNDFLFYGDTSLIVMKNRRAGYPEQSPTNMPNGIIGGDHMDLLLVF